MLSTKNKYKNSKYMLIIYQTCNWYQNKVLVFLRKVFTKYLNLK